MGHGEKLSAEKAGPGFLLVVEGIDGSGKSTLAKKLAAYCETAGFTCIVSREPTHGPHGRALRESARTGRLPLAEELALFESDRREHVESLIQPALARGEVVILDRYYFSTAAYQGARGADVAEIIRRNETFAPVPDLVLLLDLPPSIGAARIHARGDVLDDFEAHDYQRAVRENFLALARPFIERIDASARPEAVFVECRDLLDAALRRRQAAKSASAAISD